MKTKGTDFYWPNIVATVCGGMSLVLGLVVMVGWWTDWPMLVRVIPTFPAMQFNTAVSLLVCGAGLLAVAQGWQWLSLGSGLVLGVGALVLGQYWFDIDLGIDQFFYEPAQDSAHPGRMAPGTGLCLMLAGAALVILARPGCWRFRFLLLGLLSSGVVALATAVLLGYGVLGLQIVRSSWSSMALLTAVGFAVVGSGLMALAWRESQRLQTGLPRWLPLSVGFCVVTATLVLWQALAAQERAHIHHTTLSAATLVNNEIATRMRSRFLGLSSLAQRWTRPDNRPLDHKEFQSELEGRNLNGLLSLQRVGGWSFQVRWVVPPEKKENAPNPAENLKLREMLKASLDQRKNNRWLILPVGEKEVLLCLPSFFKGRATGWHVGTFHGQELLEGILPGNVAPGYSLAILTEEAPLFRRGQDSSLDLEAQWAKEREFRHYSVRWRVRVWPGAALLAQQKSSLPAVVLGAGILMAVLLSGVVFFGQIALGRAREAEASRQKMKQEILERQRAQESLQQAHAELEFRVQERTADLTRANLDLKQEIAERLRTEEALRQSETLKGAILASAMDCVITIDGHGKIVEFNPAAEKTFSHARGDVLGKELAALIIPPSYQDAHRRGLAHLLATGQGPVLGKRLEMTGLRADGGEFPVELTVLPTHIEGQPPLFTGFLRDLSAHKRAVEALHESEDRFRATFNQAAVGIAHIGLGGQLLMVNQKLCAILGYTREELLTRTFQDITHPGDLDANLEQVHQLLAGEIPTFTAEKRNLRKEGAPVWTNVTVSLDRDAAGKPRYFIAVIEDITEHKRLEEQFRQAQKMEAVGRLAGGVAHDFNNLLTVITGYSEVVLNTVRDGDPLRAFVEEVKKAGDRAASLTRQLLAFSRKQVLVPMVLDLNHLLGDMEKMLRRLIGEDMDLRVKPTGDLWRVEADPGQIEQVLLNLVVNARDAMPRGGKLTIETANRELDEDYAAAHAGVKPGLYVQLAISDTGCGMAEATKARIFEPFFTTKGPDKGTGLGLATVYGIVQQSGGHIEVYSELGVGTTFKIYLPRNEAPLPDPKMPADPVLNRPGTETVLLVEDEDAVRGLARLVLRGKGYQVLETRNGGEAFLVCEQHPGQIHLMVTDVVMLHMSGRQLAGRLASVRPEMKVLFMSGYTDEAIVHHGVLDPDTPFLQKPFSPQVLARKVREVLDG